MFFNVALSEDAFPVWGKNTFWDNCFWKCSLFNGIISLLSRLGNFLSLGSKIKHPKHEETFIISHFQVFCVLIALECHNLQVSNQLLHRWSYIHLWVIAMSWIQTTTAQKHESEVKSRNRKTEFEQKHNIVHTSSPATYSSNFSFHTNKTWNVLNNPQGKKKTNKKFNKLLFF